MRRDENGVMRRSHHKYTGRGLGWAKKKITKRQVRSVARFRAGLILESIINEGWAPPELIERYGEEGVEEIRQRINYLSAWLIDTVRAGDPDRL